MKEMGGVVEWIANCSHNYDYMKRYRSTISHDGVRADKRIKYCKKCNQCYEISITWWNGRIQIDYYKNFPSYGKEKKICMRCEEAQNC